MLDRPDPAAREKQLGDRRNFLRTVLLFRLYVPLKAAKCSLPERMNHFAVKWIAASRHVTIPGARARASLQASIRGQRFSGLKDAFE